MKILLDARLYGLENAGLGRYAVNLVRELSKIDTKNKYFVLLGKKYFDSLSLPSNWEKVLVNARHYSISEQLNLPRVIAKYKPDIVHFLHFNIPIFYKGKFVVTIHDLLMQNHRGAKATTLPFYLYYPKQIGARIVFKSAIKKAEKIIVPSYAVRDEVCSYFKVDCEKVVVTYEGVDPALLKEPSGIDKKYQLGTPYFLYVGSAYPHKNLERVIQAAVSLKVVFAISCARGVFLERLERMVRENNAESYVKLLGFVPDNNLRGLYKNCLGFIFPSLSEGFGLPGLEAMSQGAVVLASDIPVFREVYKNNVIYFDPYSVDAIKEAMNRVVNMDKKSREKIVRQGKEFVKRYSWSKMAKETLKIYEDSFSLRSG